MKHGQEILVTSIENPTTGEFDLSLTTPVDQFIRVEVSSSLGQWDGLFTFRSSGTDTLTDTTSGLSTLPRYYRAMALSETEIVTGDLLATSEGEAIIHPIEHASFLISWNGLIIYNDPSDSADLYEGLPQPDLILVSHRHGDHFSASTLESVRKAGTVIVAPASVFDRMTSALQAVTTSLANGETTTVSGMRIEAVPAYNARHTRGEGNSYVLTLGGKRFYMSGDTEDIPEMRALSNIDVAFICMNLPFTMNVTQAASAVREFQPDVVYPYHYRNQDGTFSDLEDFKSQVGSDLEIEVRFRDWY